MNDTPGRPGVSPGSNDPPEPPDSAGGRRGYAAAPFLATGIAGIAIGALLGLGVLWPGGIEAAWLAQYLALIVGLAQIGAGGGQAWLARRVPAFEWIALEWGVLNLGNLGVVVGSLIGNRTLVTAGTLAFSAALALFATLTRGGPRRAWRIAYRMFLALLLAAAWIGYALAAGAYPG